MGYFDRAGGLALSLVLFAGSANAAGFTGPGSCGTFLATGRVAECGHPDHCFFDVLPGTLSAQRYSLQGRFPVLRSFEGDRWIELEIEYRGDGVLRAVPGKIPRYVLPAEASEAFRLLKGGKCDPSK